MPPHKKRYEPGDWVNDMPDGMQKPSPPKKLTESKLSAHEIRELAAYEGLGFCIHSFISSQRIADKDLRLLWARAKNSLQKVIDYLEELPTEDPANRKKNKLSYNKRSSKSKKAKAISLGKEL